MEEQVMEFASGNEMAAIAVKQIGYDLMGYYPITPSTQIAESLDAMKAAGDTDIVMIEAEGEHSAAGICYGASVGGGRVFNATSANGLLYAIEQLPVQSGTRYPMVMNVVCRTVSGPLSIKGDHSDIMYLLSCGWPILFANTAQQVYDFNIVALKVAETVQLPVVVAYDGFFTSHQKKRSWRFTSDKSVRDFLGEKKEPMPLFDFEHPITVGSYMNEPYLMNNRYQLHLAVEQVRTVLPKVLDEFQIISGRDYQMVESYPNNDKGMLSEDTDIILILLGSAYETAIEAVDGMRAEGKSVGVVTVHTLCPFPAKQLYEVCRDANCIIVGDRQDNYGAGGGSLSLAIRAALQRFGCTIPVSNIVYGLGGQDFVANDAKKMFEMANNQNSDGNDACTGELGYYGVTPGEAEKEDTPLYFEPLTREQTQMGITQVEQEKNRLRVIGGSVNATAQMPKRLAPGHGACPGCGIIVNLNLLLRAIEDPVVLLFQTGCGMIITTPYPKTCFKVPYVHNLFQNGAATLSGIAEMAYRKQSKGELPEGDIVFIMVSGDGGLDIGMGSALGTALRGHRLLIFEYDNGGYMNTGYQMSYSTPKGAKSSTSHIGKEQYGKSFYAKDMAQIMAATHIPYVATVAESNPADFIRKAAKAAEYAKHSGTAYLKALSACPLNWNDKPANESKVIEAAVNCCYFPLYEIENGITTLNFDPEEKGNKIPVGEWFAMMGRTKHLMQKQYKDVLWSIQAETDRRFQRLREMSKHPML